MYETTSSLPSYILVVSCELKRLGKAIAFNYGFPCFFLSTVKFMFSKKATKIDKIFNVDLTVTTYCQIDGGDFVNFCGLLRKREL